MKKYRVCLIDFSIKNDNKKIVFTKYTDGLKNARGIYPDIKVKYFYNVKCFSGWKDNKQLIISEL